MGVWEQTHTECTRLRFFARDGLQHHRIRFPSKAVGSNFHSTTSTKARAARAAKATAPLDGARPEAMPNTARSPSVHNARCGSPKRHWGSSECGWPLAVAPRWDTPSHTNCPVTNQSQIQSPIQSQIQSQIQHVYKSLDSRRTL